MAEMNTNKRRRKEGLHISDLPDNALAHVATYLSNISRAIFAIASPSASQLTILSNDEKLWETLDFRDIDKSLARRLKDNDIRDILGIINALHNTKFLKLTGCISIIGSGLSPLRGSTALKQLDLGLVGQYRSPDIHPEPIILEDAVLPILTSIINAGGNSMTHLQLPRMWRDNRSSQLTDFLEAYNDVLARRQSKCKSCNELINSDGDRSHVIREGSVFGIQNFICYTCLDSFCDNCESEDGRDMLAFCYTCKKDYCASCNEMEYCDKCGYGFCIECDSLKSCRLCDTVFCPNCAPSKKCACDGVLCRVCTKESTHSCKWEGCEEVFCSNCQDDHLLSHRIFDCD